MPSSSAGKKTGSKLGCYKKLRMDGVSRKSTVTVTFGLCIFSLCFQACSAVKIRTLDVPEVALSGHSVHLTCDYDLERQRLYQVKWYKGSHEFYRYSPSNRDKTQVFLVKNLLIDFHNSNDRTVVLKELHVDMTGRYTCEVSTEGIFETVKASAEMTVVAVPRGGPHIQGYKTEVSLGDELQLNCTSLKSKPAAKLQFYINNKPSNGRRWAELRNYVITNEQERPQTESAVLSMRFRVRKHHVHLGRIHVRCQASIMQIYQRDKIVEIFVKTHEAAKISNAKGGVEGGGASSATDSGVALSATKIVLFIATLETILLLV